MRHRSASRLALATLYLASACGAPEPEPLEGLAPTFEVDGNGTVVEVGATVKADEIDRVMAGRIFAEGVSTYDDVVSEQTFVNHLAIEFNPNGHGPPGVNDVPHFDVHFYGISIEARGSITCDGQPVPDPERVPAGYDASAVGAPPFGSCEPEMGVHAGDEDSLEGKLDAELILGYDRGSLVFIEPMIHASHFEARDTMTLEIPRPQVLGRETLWPSTFTLSFDQAADVFTFTLGDFAPIR